MLSGGHHLVLSCLESSTRHVISPMATAASQDLSSEDPEVQGISRVEVNYINTERQYLSPELIMG